MWTVSEAGASEQPSCSKKLGGSVKESLEEDDGDDDDEEDDDEDDGDDDEDDEDEDDEEDAEDEEDDDEDEDEDEEEDEDDYEDDEDEDDGDEVEEEDGVEEKTEANVVISGIEIEAVPKRSSPEAAEVIPSLQVQQEYVDTEEVHKGISPSGIAQNFDEDMLPGSQNCGIAGNINLDEDCVVSAIRVESRLSYEDECDEVFSDHQGSNQGSPADITPTQSMCGTPVKKRSDEEDEEEDDDDWEDDEEDDELLRIEKNEMNLGNPHTDTDLLDTEPQVGDELCTIVRQSSEDAKNSDGDAEKKNEKDLDCESSEQKDLPEDACPLAEPKRIVDLVKPRSPVVVLNEDWKSDEDGEGEMSGAGVKVNFLATLLKKLDGQSGSQEDSWGDEDGAEQRDQSLPASPKHGRPGEHEQGFEELLPPKQTTDQELEEDVANQSPQPTDPMPLVLDKPDGETVERDEVESLPVSLISEDVEDVAKGFSADEKDVDEIKDQELHGKDEVQSEDSDSEVQQMEYDFGSGKITVVEEESDFDDTVDEQEEDGGEVINITTTIPKLFCPKDEFDNDGLSSNFDDQDPKSDRSSLDTHVKKIVAVFEGAGANMKTLKSLDKEHIQSSSRRASPCEQNPEMHKFEFLKTKSPSSPVSPADELSEQEQIPQTFIDDVEVAVTFEENRSKVLDKVVEVTEEAKDEQEEGRMKPVSDVNISVAGSMQVLRETSK